MSLSYNINKQPYFSIIVATLNAERTIEKCINSIIHQTAGDKIEILIKDGASSDNTIDILKTYEKEILYWESSPDSGVYDAWNQILPKASGKWILFLGSDDTLFNNSVITKSFSILEEAAESIDISYGRVRLVSIENEMILDLGRNWNRTRKCIKEKMCMPHQGIFHKRSLFTRHGYFNTNYYISSDYDFIRRVISEDNVLYMNMIISCMRVGGISSNPKNTFIRLKEIRQINRKYGIYIPGPLWLITYTNACFRHSLFFLVGEKSGKYILDLLRKIVGLPSFWTKI